MSKSITEENLELELLRKSTEIKRLSITPPITSEVYIGKTEKIIKKHRAIFYIEDLEELLEQSIQKSIKERELQLKKGIGFLRQWLNERTSKELVTNEDLENWLLSDLSQK